MPVGGGGAWPGFEATRRAEGSQRGRRAGGSPPTGTQSSPAPRSARNTRGTTSKAYRSKRVGFGLVGFVPGSAVVEVGAVNCGSPPVDLGLCLGAVAGLVELVNDLLVGDRGFKDVCWGGRELGVQVAPPQHGLDLVIKTHATVGS